MDAEGKLVTEEENPASIQDNLLYRLLKAYLNNLFSVLWKKAFPFRAG